MRARALLLTDGTSDEPLATHAAGLARGQDLDLDVVVPALDLLSPSPGKTIEARLRRVLDIDPYFDAVLVHRDAERQSPDARRREVRDAFASVGIDLPYAVIVPIRMTEAWLLLDEVAIRRVAGRPSQTGPLGLPNCSRLEGLADPKAVLSQALVRASGYSGRRLQLFKRDFAYHRRALLEQLDRTGDVRRLSGWLAFEAAISQLVEDLRARGSRPADED
jgi:hypothetical protein